MINQTIKQVIYSIIVISLCLAIGKLLYKFAGGLPASLYGMISLNVLLHFKMIDPEKLSNAIAWAIKNMGVCFVPAGVGIINHYDLVAQFGVAIVAIIFISTFVLITFVGLSVEKFFPTTPSTESAP